MATKRYKRDLKEPEARRRRGMRMLAHGVSQAEVARSCEVSRQTAMTWARRLAEDAQAWRRRPLGRPGVFGPKQRTRLSKLLLQGAVANGFPTEHWTLSRVARLIERPTRIRTWAPKGQTPVLQYSFNWKQLALIAGSSFWPLYFRCFHGAIRSPQIVEFLKALKATIRGKLLVTSGTACPHTAADAFATMSSCCPATSSSSACQPTRPNSIRSSTSSDTPNSTNWPTCAPTIEAVRSYATRRIESMQRRPKLIRAFWQQAELDI